MSYNYKKKHLVVNEDVYDKVIYMAQNAGKTHNEAVTNLLQDAESLVAVRQERDLLTEKITTLVTECNQKITECNQADNQKITELQEEITKLQEEITRCNQADNQKITELQEEITELQEEITQCNRADNQKITELQEEITKLQEEITGLNDIKNRLSNEVTKPDLLMERLGELRFQYIRFSALVRSKRTGQTVTVWDIVDKILQEYYDGIAIGGSVIIPNRSQKQSIKENLAKYE